MNDKVAIVTGGTGALGREVSNHLAEQGMKVYIPARSIETFRKIFDNSDNAESFTLRKIYCMPCDAEDPAQIKIFVNDILKREKKIDYLINTIGGYHTKKNISEMDNKLFHDMMGLNFRTTFLFTKNVLSSMIENKFGRIISISAKAALEFNPGKFAYSLSKYAVIHLMNTLAEENRHYNINANTIAPFIIDTPANRKSMPEADYSAWTSSKAIAEIILFLLSEKGNNITGNVIKV